MEIGAREILLLAVVILFFFGTEKIPELSRGIAESIRHLRGAFTDDGSTKSKR